MPTHFDDAISERDLYEFADADLEPDDDEFDDDVDPDDEDLDDDVDDEDDQ